VTGSRKLFIDGPAGKLQALWRSGGDREHFTRAAIVCHPHPQFGGTMENKVVARASRYISETGIEAIRFNFRGVGQSEGTFDNGAGEREDLRAVIEHVTRISPHARLAVVGFSFGAWVGLSVGAAHPAVCALVGIAPPVRMFDFQYFESLSKPTLIVYAGNDQFTDPGVTQEWIASGRSPVESILFPGVDHFFGPQVDEAGRKIAEFLDRVL
jgi:alpha/beta superfamily hydrolase